MTLIPKQSLISNVVFSPQCFNVMILLRNSASTASKMQCVLCDACSAWTSRSKTHHLNSNRMAPAVIKVGVYSGMLQTNQS